MKLAFEEYTLCSDNAELRRDGTVVPVEPQVFELLMLLAGSEGRLVSRDEIFEKIWDNRIVSDAALSSRVRDARKAVGDDGTTQRLIRTVHRRGFRFMGAAQMLGQTPSAPDIAASPAAPQTPAGAAPVPIPPGVAANDPTEAVFHRPAVAVLPFEDRSVTPSQMLANQLVDEVVDALAAWRFFPVISRASTVRFRDATEGARAIGEALNARYFARRLVPA